MKQYESIKQQEEEYRRKEMEIERQERQHPRWNVDNIGHTGFDRTIVNKSSGASTASASASASAPAPAPVPEPEPRQSVNFMKEHKAEIKHFGLLHDPDASHAYLCEYPELLCEDTANYLVIWALELEIEGVCRAPCAAASCMARLMPDWRPRGGAGPHADEARRAPMHSAAVPV